MSLIFDYKQITDRGRGLTFDDVLLVPQHSEISSRRHPSLKSKVTKNFELDTPVITANMDTITELEMAKAMAKLGGLGIIHRFMTTKEQGQQIKDLVQFQEDNNINLPVAASIGVKEDGMKRADYLVDCGAKILTIDIAHGDSVMMLETLKYVKNKFPNIDVIAGNVATAGGVRRLIEAGADAVKVGIGPGSMCTTRIITGHGVPQLSAIAMCVEEANKHEIPVIADGGIKTSGDMVKSFCAGASTVMVGSLVSGTLETPGELKSGMKQYRGTAQSQLRSLGEGNFLREWPLRVSIQWFHVKEVLLT